jgi:hypothetical protein
MFVVPQTAGAVRTSIQRGPVGAKAARGGAMEEDELDCGDSEYEDDDSETTSEGEDGFAEAEGPSRPATEESPTR